MTHERHEAPGEMPGFVPFRKGAHEVVKPVHNRSSAPATIKAMLMSAAVNTKCWRLFLDDSATTFPPFTLYSCTSYSLP
jgi:hypothetical protein